MAETKANFTSARFVEEDKWSGRTDGNKFCSVFPTTASHGIPPSVLRIIGRIFSFRVDRFVQTSLSFTNVSRAITSRPFSHGSDEESSVGTNSAQARAALAV